MVTMTAPRNHIELLPLPRYELDQRRRTSSHTMLWNLLDEVYDPEVPVMSIWELGVLQDVEVCDADGGAFIRVLITPTYSGCPAVAHMSSEIKQTLNKAGFANVVVEPRLAPAWTTDWLSTPTKEKLRAYGIAPPDNLSCPQCHSELLKQISEFGSTACKSLYRCQSCDEVFDYFKSI